MRLYCINVQLDCSKCNFGLQVDPYPTSCTHGCVYCWSYEQQFLEQDIGSDLTLEIFEKILSDQSFNHPLSLLLKEKVPIRIGHSTDPLPPEEKVVKRTLGLIQILNRYQYPFVIVTKSALVATDPYINAIKQGNGSVQISLISLSDSLLKKIEPRATSATDRFEAIKKLYNTGIYTSVRVSPIIDGIDYTELLINLAEIGSINIIASVGELTPRALKALRGLGMIIAPYSSQKQVEFTIEAVKQICDELGLIFNHCYLGSTLSKYSYEDSHHDCCNTFKSFKGTSLSAIKGNLIPMYQINYRKGKFAAIMSILQQKILERILDGIRK